MGLSLTETEHGLSGPSPSPDSGTQTTTTRARVRASVSSSTSIWGFAFFSSSLLNVPWLRFCPSLGGMQPRVPSSLHQWVNSHTSQALPHVSQEVAIERLRKKHWNHSSSARVAIVILVDVKRTPPLYIC
ncbi:unnamed protein product [Prunus brigantina]